MTTGILIVDDDIQQRTLISSILSDEGYRTFDADGVDSALEIVAGNDIGLIITDLKMDKRSGLELVEAICQTEEHPEIVMMTAFGTVETAVKAIHILFRWQTLPGALSLSNLASVERW